MKSGPVNRHHRDLSPLEPIRYDLLILGGGVTGAAILWDASLRGLKCLLLEKEDYAHATSSATSKMAHGGLRYLKMLDFSLVRESLRERRILQEIAPHQVTPLSFLLPTYKDWGRSRVFFWSAMALYEALSYDKADLADPDQRLKSFFSLNSAQVLEQAPILPPKNLTGGFVYQDCQMHDPERIVWSLIRGAKEQGAEAHNYLEATALRYQGRRVVGVEAKDRLSEKTYHFTAQAVINASGPWSDQIAGWLQNKPTHHLMRSKGIHILVDRLPHQEAIALFTKKGRHLFILPWQGMTLFGTTDEAFLGGPDELTLDEGDLTRFLAVINEALPALRLTLKDIRHFYAGIRPMTASQTQEATNSYQVSRKHELIHHATEGYPGFYSATGGKFTTSRGLAEECIDLVAQQEGWNLPPCKTASTPLWGGDIGNLARFTQSLAEACPNLPPLWVQGLARRQGSKAREIAEQAMEKKSLQQKIGLNLLRAEVEFILEEEQVWHLSDLLFRRLGLGNLGDPGSSFLFHLAHIAGQKWGWDEARIKAEAKSCQSHYIPGKPLYQTPGP